MLISLCITLAHASPPELPDVPENGRVIDWPTFEETARERCRAIRTRGDFAAVIGAHIYVTSQISASFADAAESDLPRVSGQVRDAMLRINEGPSAVPTLFEIEELRVRLRGRASDLALDVARITPEIVPYASEPTRRLRVRDRRSAIDGCVEHMVGIVKTVTENRVWAEEERDRLQAALDGLFRRFPHALESDAPPKQTIIVVREAPPEADPVPTVSPEAPTDPVVPERPRIGYGPHP